MILIDKYGFISDRDSAHNGAFYAYALYENNDLSEAENIFDPIERKLFKSIIWPYKHPSYRWSNSEGLTKWLYDSFRLNPLKGSNPDQIQPVLFYCLLTGRKILQIKIIIGLILRLGFFPNGEHVLFKMQTLGPLFRRFHLYPLYFISDFYEYIGSMIDLRIPINISTTNKIRTYLYLATAKNQQTVWIKLIKRYILKRDSLENYFSGVFHEYWKKGSALGNISEIMPYYLA